VKLYSLICDAPGLPLTAAGSIATTLQWRGVEELGLGHIRGGALVAPKQMSIHRTSVLTSPPVSGDFPYLYVRAGAQGLT
jgi:hypothetical protein